MCERNHGRSSVVALVVFVSVRNQRSTRSPQIYVFGCHACASVSDEWPTIPTLSYGKCQLRPYGFNPACHATMTGSSRAAGQVPSRRRPWRVRVALGAKLTHRIGPRPPIHSLTLLQHLHSWNLQVRVAIPLKQVAQLARRLITGHRSHLSDCETTPSAESLLDRV